MQTTVVKVDDSQNTVRLPKKWLDKSGIREGKVGLQIEPGAIRIVSDERRRAAAVTPELLAAEVSLAKDWNRPEEDAAWAYLQSEK